MSAAAEYVAGFASIAKSLSKDDPDRQVWETLVDLVKGADPKVTLQKIGHVLNLFIPGFMKELREAAKRRHFDAKAKGVLSKWATDPDLGETELPENKVGIIDRRAEFAKSAAIAVGADTKVCFQPSSLTAVQILEAAPTAYESVRSRQRTSAAAFGALVACMGQQVDAALQRVRKAEEREREEGRAALALISKAGGRARLERLFAAEPALSRLANHVDPILAAVTVSRPAASRPSSRDGQGEPNGFKTPAGATA